MDIESLQKNHSSGHESHGVHLCQKCGWPFPNPHPSAKHRRSHRKICGAIEGYKLFNSAASDEEPLSEESHKTPFGRLPKVMESCDLVKNIGGVGAISNRSEDEIFSDAAMEFQDGGFGLGRQHSFADKDLTPTVSFKDCEDTCDVIPIETEPPMDVPEESRKLGGGDKVAEWSVRQDVSEESRKVVGSDKVVECSVRQETDTEENDLDSLKKNLSGTLILPGKHAGETSETLSMSEKRLDGASGMVLNEVMFQLEEEVSDRSASKTSINENAEQEVDGNGNPGINLEENLMNVVESNSELASVTSERTDDITSNTRLAGKVVEDKENGDELALNTLIDDLSPKAESAKDIGASLCTSQILSDAAQITVSDTSFNSNEVYDKTDKEDEVRDCVSHEKSVTFPSNQLNEDNKADTSCTRFAEDGSNQVVVKEGLVEGKADVIQLDKGSDALGSFVDADTTANKKGPEVFSLEENQPVYVSDGLYKTSSSGHMINVLPSANPTVSHADVEARKLNNVVGSDDMDIPESAKTGVIDLAEDDKTRRLDDENYVKSTLTYDSSLYQANPAPNLLEVENSTSESVIPHHQSPVVTKEGNNEYTRALPETKGPHSNGVSNSPGDIMDSKISRDNKEQGECVGEVMASAVESSGGNESNETSPNQLNNGSIHAPLDPEPTTQNSGAVDAIHTRESKADISGTRTVSLQGEADNCSIIPQLGATIGDVSKSSSQTDSLDGQWGSVSVLSTRSDNLPATDTENLPSTGSHQSSEPEKANIKKPSVASGEKQLDKSDEFEPPSFMTLVEPGGSDQTTAMPPQAGWFPSLTHTANESHGRKKNEEIIAKVTNWNAKQHTPLKSLLGEAITETNPNSKEPPREGKVAMVTKVSSILGPESPDAEPTNVETVKEWNSPPRYQADIKRQKKKVKSKPLWAQFVCCSYVN
ncbi:hypothetical protein HRI_000852600 [Hibiscus trionum]|uniref:C2H2-type domain-containing protein n=1 Tax=Hibiscus trionum TaxID=183268 RepID=A0A9W7H706_HIBTR|nr:hypothetical protein HRI_000852600 [Hibiscus trionum]